MGRGGTPAREISFVSLVAYGPNSDSALIMGVTASETRQGGSQQVSYIIVYIYTYIILIYFNTYIFYSIIFYYFY